MKSSCYPLKCEGFAVVITSFSVFQSIRGKEGCNSIKNTMAESCDNPVFGVSEHPRENRVITLITLGNETFAIF